jgi:hypothetical protein
LRKLDEAEARLYYGWPDIDALLEGCEPSSPRQPGLPGLSSDLIPEWRRINVRGVRVERVREFGRIWAALAVWRRLGLHRLLADLMPTGQEDVGWDLIACILSVGRFCAQAIAPTSRRWRRSTPVCANGPRRTRRRSNVGSGVGWVAIRRQSEYSTSRCAVTPKTVPARFV